MPHEFGRWWNCLKKHYKRTECWLPRAQQIANSIRPPRPFRYFTLCARPMIDVFMLARQRLLEHDENFGHISDVVFCESDKEDYPEIIEMLEDESAGFPNRLEDLVLFADDDFTAGFPDLESVKLGLDDDLLSDEKRDRLRLKEQYFELTKKFPFDFLNLDFCGYYYPQPPSVLVINNTVKTIVDLQGPESVDSNGKALRVDRFVMSITCKFDDSLPEAAFVRLEQIVSVNARDHRRYREAIQGSARPIDSHQWRASDSYDFFLSSWPKEILGIAQERGWGMEILDYVHYRRPRDKSIVCLVVSLERNGEHETYVDECLRALDRDARVFIDEIPRDSQAGGRLLADLQDIVAIRNERAALVGRPPLPEP
jgi:hypothetical protein